MTSKIYPDTNSTASLQDLNPENYQLSKINGVDAFLNGAVQTVRHHCKI